MEKSFIFYGLLKSETQKAWMVFDGINEIWIAKSLAKLRRMSSVDDYEITIPEWLAKQKGIL